MKERPILMNGAMVRATLAGTKTQTRRVMKRQPEYPIVIAGDPHTNRYQMGAREAVTLASLLRECPYGQPGDRLWVRETHRAIWGQSPGYLIGVDYKADPQEKWERMRDHVGRPKWTPSIHMFREHSRILLEIVSVRVERLNNITLGDICKEGLARSIYDFCPATDGFRIWKDLWESINGAGSYDANPWVWVVQFERVTS